MKKINLIGLLLLLVSMFSLVSASVSIDLPSASSSVSGNVTVNVTFVQAEEIVNCTLYLQSALSGNSTWTSLGTFANVTDISVTAGINSSTFNDANDYILNATCMNLSTDTSDDTNTGITIDNTVPDAPSSISPSTNTQIKTATAQTFSSTVTDRETTSCTYTIYRDGSASDTKSASGSGTYSGTSCSFTKTFSDSSDNGKYYVTFTASDETNTTASSVVFYDVAIAGSNGGLPPGSYTTDQGQTLTITDTGQVLQDNWMLIAGILVVVAIAIWIIKKR